MSVAIICPNNSRNFPTIVITQEGERAENNEVGTLKPYLVYWAWHVFTATWAANKWTSRLWRLSANNIITCLCFLKYQSKFTTHKINAEWCRKIVKTRVQIDNSWTQNLPTAQPEFLLQMSDKKMDQTTFLSQTLWQYSEASAFTDVILVCKDGKVLAWPHLIFSTAGALVVITV